MSAEPGLFEAWCVPVWERAEGSGRPAGPLRSLPAARTRAGEPSDLVLAVPGLGAADATRLVRALRSAREGLLARPAEEIAGVLGRVGARFLDPRDPIRREALDRLPSSTGLSPAMCAEVLDGMARDWTGERLEGALRADFPDPSVLDRFVASPDAGGSGRRRAMGASFAFHLSAGSVPGVSTTSLVRSLLVKTPVLVKPGRGDVALPVLFLRALAEEDAAIAEAGAVVYWPGGEDAWAGVEEAVLAEAELVVAYGGDALIRGLRSRLEPTSRLVPYHHRLGFAMVGRAGLTGDRERMAAEVARAVAIFDQRGCVSPHAVFVETSGRREAEAFAENLADAFRTLDAELPPGRADDAEASARQQLRGTYELRAAAGEGVSLRSGGASPWTVVVDPGGELEPSCLGRTVRVLPVEDLAEVPGRVGRLGRHLQTAGHAGVEAPRLEALAESLARVGVLRVAPLAAVPFPPAWWRHDGRGPLEVLIRWIEMGV